MALNAVECIDSNMGVLGPITLFVLHGYRQNSRLFWSLAIVRIWHGIQMTQLISFGRCLPLGDMISYMIKLSLILTVYGTRDTVMSGSHSQLGLIGDISSDVFKPIPLH
jgi:hypothetical protein